MPRIACKICRRLGESVCGRQKCAFRRKPYPPGKLESEKKHRSSRSEFGAHLIEKQKVRHSYGLSEKQFSNYVKEIREKKGANPANALYERLERRLDNVVFRMGLAASRALARQFVSHGHFTVNGRRVTVPSYTVSVGDKVAVREGSKSLAPFKELREKLSNASMPVWLKVSPEEGAAEISGKPAEAHPGYNFNSVLEFYSR